ncbi:hypothetical protein CAP35_04205 [Chitinophagaceae bacterium IBVUCB1]|nr:hypothetical protein CAP35_04205 [Chitinophagaceae bacterium IBVUCB1]
MSMLIENNAIKAIINTLNYFFVFRHPLLPDEIHKFSSISLSHKLLLNELTTAVDCGLIFEYNGYYMPAYKPEYVAEREAGAVRARLLMKEAYKSAAIIANFPFVSSVCISGSLSKGYAAEKSDIDLFIITEKNRLWICRTLLHLYKKMTFLQGKEHSFCMNYFIDESRMCIDEQNIFTATELATLIPAYNEEKHRELLQANKGWLVNVLPNMAWNTDIVTTSVIKKGWRKLAEPILNLLLPKYLNIALMHITNTLWRAKWKRKKYPMQDYDLAMKTRWYVSKNHPLNYQKKVLGDYTKVGTASNIAAAL